MSNTGDYAEHVYKAGTINPVCAVTVLDGISIPFIMRGLQASVPVRLIERHFLSKYMNTGNLSVTSPLPSYYITETEANLLSTAGQGVFTTQDLVVSLAGFLGMYEKLKKMFPVVQKPTGGWVQINNTVIPFVVKDDSKMIALSIVRCAAGLLIGREVPSVYPNQAECEFLNSSCKEAGIQFEFTSQTELVELVLLECMCDENPVIRELPEGNPFAVAEFMDRRQLLSHDQSPATTDKETVTTTMNIPTNVANGSIPYDRSNQIFCNSFPHVGNIALIDTSSVKVIQPVSDYNSDPNTDFCAELVQTHHTGPAAPVLTSNQTLQSLIRAKTNKVPLKRMNRTQGNSTPTNPAYAKPNIISKKSSTAVKDLPTRPAITEAKMIKDFLANAGKPDVKNTKTKKTTAANYPQSVIQRAVLMESATDEEKQLMTHRMQELSSKFGHTINRAGENLMLCRVNCFGKTISCMVKNEELYILLEAMNRLYFPTHNLEAVCNVIVNLGIAVFQLTDEEEREFVKFYRLPAHRLNSNRTIRVSDFINIYQPLSCILNSSEFAPLANLETSRPIDRAADVNAAIRSAAVNPVPIGNPVLNTANFLHAQSNAERYNPNLSQLLSSETATGSDNCNTDRTPKRAAETSLNSIQQLCVDSYSNYSDVDSISPQPIKRSRTRVIGEVICIDD